MKYLYLALILSLCNILNGCGSNSNSSQNITPPEPPTPDILIDPSDINLVKSIQFSIYTRNGVALPYINLTKFGDLFKYKIWIYNPNGFIMNIANINFENNIYFERNSESDNCFNKSDWYILNFNNKTMNLKMPAKQGCFLYANSLWLQNESNNNGVFFENKVISYAINNDEWGYFEGDNIRNHIWCRNNTKCKIDNTETTTNGENKLVFKLLNIVSKSYDFLKDRKGFIQEEEYVPMERFSLNGKYVFTIRTSDRGFSVTRNAIIFDKDNQKFSLNNNDSETFENQCCKNVNFTNHLIPRYDGIGAMAIFGLGYPINTFKKYYAIYIKNKDFHGLYELNLHKYDENDSFKNGIDNKIWANSGKNYETIFKSEDDYLSCYKIESLSENLKNIKNVVWSDKNHILEGDNFNRITNCYQADNNYQKIYSQGIFYPSTKLLSYNKFYVTSSINNFKFYDFNNNEIDLPSNINIEYEFNPNTCNIENDKFLIIQDETLITNEFIAIKTKTGYAVFSNNNY